MGGEEEAGELDWPNAVTVSPDGGQVYASVSAGDAVTVFGRDPTTGQLTLTQVVPLPETEATEVPLSPLVTSEKSGVSTPVTASLKVTV